MAEAITSMPGHWWTQHRQCPICTPEAFTLCDKPLYHVPADGPLAACDVVTCSNCGFTFSDTPTTQAEFDRYYAESKRYGADVTGTNSWNEERYNHTAHRIAELIPDAAWSVLDVGSGAGGLGSELNLLDMHPTSTNAYLQHVPCPSSGRWRCVTLCHVLEHVRDLDPAMRNLAAIAETVYAEVPDAARYHEFCESPYQQFNSEHVNHFASDHLQQLFKYHGFVQVAFGRGECGDPPPHMQPYIWGFFERQKRSANAMRAYCDKSATLWQQIEAKISELRSRDCQFIVWGVGQLFQKLRCLFGMSRIAAAVDSTYREIDGKTVGPPQNLVNSGLTCPILITTIQHRESVLADIRRLGLKNEVITLP